MRYWEDQDNLQNRSEPEDGYFMSQNELYDLTSNLGESGNENLYDNDSQLTKDLENILLKWLQSVNAKMPTAVQREDQWGATPRVV